MVIDMGVIGAELVEVGWRASDDQSQIVHLAAAFADSNEWALAGYSSASRWIAEQLEIARRTANEWIRIGQTAKSDTDAWPLLGQQRADALTEVLSTGGTGTTTEVIIHVRGNGATLDDGTPMTMTTVSNAALESHQSRQT